MIMIHKIVKKGAVCYDLLIIAPFQHRSCVVVYKNKNNFRKGLDKVLFYAYNISIIF